MPESLWKCAPCFTTAQPAAFTAAHLSAIVSLMSEAQPNARPAGLSTESNLDHLLDAVMQKDRHAFEDFYDATVQRIYSLALRVTRNHEMAEEVVGDVYLQVWRQVERYDASRGNVMAWLTVLCRSRALDAMRRNRPANTHETTSNDAVPETADFDHPQDLLIAVEEKSVVHRALLKLPEQQRQLLALAYFRGYSHNELAQFTGLPVGTVKTRLRRTLQILRDMMSGDDGALGELK